MKFKNATEWFLIGVTGVVLSAVFILFLNRNIPGRRTVVELPQPMASGDLTEASPGSPVSDESARLPVLRLRIPKINVAAEVESVGLTPDGDMGVPSLPGNAAWFKLGPRPGETGSAVIDGHSGTWEDGTLAVFDNLHKLQKGDKLYVEDENGTTVFVVRESKIYDPAADATAVFSSSDGRAHLNLITCEGVWNNAQQSYSQRLIVFADKEIE